jgi:hypothetical protein
MSHRFRIFAVLLLAAIVTPVGGAPSPKAPAADKPKPPQIVTVKKSDGSSVRGKVAANDREHLTIDPVEGNKFGAPIEIAWSDVKSVSNGLTHQKALEAWKVEHKSELCETCHGEGHIDCEICKGTGHDPAASKDCPTCKGEVVVDCPEKHCDAGKIPCPGPCLKLSEGTWTKPDAEGKRWRTIPISGGTFRVSTGHLGEIVKSGKRGEAPTLTPCEICGRTGSITCPTCGGDHKVTCPTCKADKSAADCAACEDGKVACKTCGGTGLKGGTTPPAPQPTAATPATPAKPAKRAVNDSDGF